MYFGVAGAPFTLKPVMSQMSAQSATVFLNLSINSKGVMNKNTENRAVYVAPQLIEFGRVASVTAAVGATFLTDTELTGSMAFPGMVPGDVNPPIGGMD
jgi:hypothetical protein